MTVVLVAYGSRGDVEPMTALALELQRLGVEVVLCAPPDFVNSAAAIGIAPIPIGWPIRALATGTLGDSAPRGLAGVARELPARTYEAVVQQGSGLGAVVAAGSLPAVAGARAAAETLGLPFVAVCPSPCYLPSPHHPPVAWPGQVVPEGPPDNLALWDLNAQHLNAVLGGPINQHRAEVGLPPTDNIRDHVHADHLVLAADPVLGPWLPTELPLVQTGAWIRPDTRPLPGDLEDFLDTGDPPVYVGFGSMPLRQAPDAAAAVVEAVRNHGRRLVLGRGWADLHLDPSDDVCPVGDVSHQVLFPRVAAVVHHGGAGTTTAAARAGAPQVVVPQVADQPYWADRVVALGLGSRLDGAVPTSDSLSAALATALEPGTAALAAAVARTIRTDGAERAAQLVADLAHEAGPKRVP